MLNETQKRILCAALEAMVEQSLERDYGVGELPWIQNSDGSVRRIQHDEAVELLVLLQQDI